MLPVRTNEGAEDIDAVAISYSYVYYQPAII